MQRPNFRRLKLRLQTFWHSLVMCLENPAFWHKYAPLGIIFASAILFGFVIALSTRLIARHDNPEPSDTPPTEVIDAPSTTDPAPFLNLQPTVDSWRTSVNATVSLAIYDLDNEQLAASLDPNRRMNIASIYKLFFAYPLYAEISAGRLDPNTHFVTTSDYRAGDYTLGACLDLIIRESYNGCADSLLKNRAVLGLVTNFMSGLNLKYTTTPGLTSTANDLITLLRKYYEHPDLSADAWAQLSDSMLNQPVTLVGSGIIYNWRQGLPSGFSIATVYDKVGWAYNDAEHLWNTYADAAIIELNGRHYAIAVLTSGLKTTPPFALQDLGARLEAAIINS